MIKKGFTLLEMLVVIGIIAVLVSMGFASYSTVQKKSRDAKRQGDLKAAQQSLEQCYSINGYQYPTIDDTSGTISTSGITGCTADPKLDFSITDPLNSTPYKYTRSSSSSDYSITATLENGTTFSVSNQQ